MNPAPGPSSRLAPVPAVAALALCGLYFLAQLHTLGELGYPLDDSYIHLQFARELAAGNGLAFNPGELVTGSSSPLFTALVSLGFLLPGLSLLWPQLLGIAGLLATAAGTRRLLEQLGAEPLFQHGGALLVATSPWLLWSALSGMEVLLFAGLIVWTLVFAAREEAREADGAGHGLGAPLLAALAALARPEGLLLLALLLVCRALRLERPAEGPPRLSAGKLPALGEAALLALLLVAPLLAFNAAVGGSPWPTTLAAKTVADDSFLPNARYLSTALTVLWDGGGLLLLFAGAGALVLLGRAEGACRSLLPSLLLFGLPFAYSLLASAKAPPPVGNFGRYLFPLLPLLAALALLGLEAGLAPFRRGLQVGRRILPLPALALGLLVLIQLAQGVRGLQHYAQNLEDVAGSDVAAARWLAERLPPEALIATQDIGAIKLLLPNRIVDLTGIATPGILPALRGDGAHEGGIYWEQRLLTYLAGEKPDLMVAFANSYPGLAGGRLGNFRKVASFKLERNITMAGSELVILETPWCRFPGALAARP